MRFSFTFAVAAALVASTWLFPFRCSGYAITGKVDREAVKKAIHAPGMEGIAADFYNDDVFTPLDSRALFQHSFLVAGYVNPSFGGQILFPGILHEIEFDSRVPQANFDEYRQKIVAIKTNAASPDVVGRMAINAYQGKSLSVINDASSVAAEKARVHKALDGISPQIAGAVCARLDMMSELVLGNAFRLMGNEEAALTHYQKCVEAVDNTPQKRRTDADFRTMALVGQAQVRLSQLVEGPEKSAGTSFAAAMECLDAAGKSSASTSPSLRYSIDQCALDALLELSECVDASARRERLGEVCTRADASIAGIGADKSAYAQTDFVAVRNCRLYARILLARGYPEERAACEEEVRKLFDSPEWFVPERTPRHNDMYLCALYHRDRGLQAGAKRSEELAQAQSILDECVLAAGEVETRTDLEDCCVVLRGEVLSLRACDSPKDSEALFNAAERDFNVVVMRTQNETSSRVYVEALVSLAESKGLRASKLPKGEARSRAIDEGLALCKRFPQYLKYIDRSRSTAQADATRARLLRLQAEDSPEAERLLNLQRALRTMRSAQGVLSADFGAEAFAERAKWIDEVAAEIPAGTPEPAPEPAQVAPEEEPKDKADDDPAQGKSVSKSAEKPSEEPEKPTTHQ